MAIAFGMEIDQTIHEVQTYEEMLTLLTGDEQRMFLVRSSSINGGEQTLYHYNGATGGLYWVASVRIN